MTWECPKLRFARQSPKLRFARQSPKLRFARQSPKLRFARSRFRNQSGQSILEYMLVLCVIVSAVMLVLGLLRNSDFFYKRVTEPLVRHITYNYKYGDPRSQGWDENAPRLHIQISRPNEGATFRLFQPSGD